MSCSIEKLSALDMAVYMVAGKEDTPDITAEEEVLFTEIESLIASTMENTTIMDRLVTIKAALEGS